MKLAAQIFPNHSETKAKKEETLDLELIASAEKKSDPFATIESYPSRELREDRSNQLLSQQVLSNICYSFPAIPKF